MTDRSAPAPRDAGGQRAVAVLSTILVTAGVLLPLAGMLPELLHPTADLNDGAFHLGVARETIAVVREGGNPIDFWMPTWLAGFPLFHYYQPGPYFLLAVLDLLSGGMVPLLVQYRALTMVALAAFPLANYVAARRLGLPRETAGWAALLSFAIAGGARYGIELESFTWYGWGLFTQAIALPLLPLALAAGWRATQEGGRTLRCAVLLAATFLAHVLYGYIASLSLLLVPLASPRLDELRRRLATVLRLQAQSFCLLAFFVVPLIWHSAYHAKSLFDEASKFDSHGAETIIIWLLSGDLLDHARLPVMTLLCGCGLYLCARDWLLGRSAVHGWIACCFCFWTLLYFGRPTWGSMIDLLPMTRGLHLERLSSAVDLFAVWLAAIAAGRMTSWCFQRDLAWWKRTAALPLLAAIALIATERIQYVRRSADAVIAAKEAFDRDSEAFDPMLRFLREHPGRVYAGHKGNWGDDYKIGQVSTYHVLSAQGIPTIGHAPFSWAWSTDFQVQLDWPEPWAADLYDIRYLLTDRPGVEPAGWELALVSGRHRLYRRAGASAGPFALVAVPTAIAGGFDDTWYMTESWTKGIWPRQGVHARLLQSSTEVPDVPVIRILDAFRFSLPDGAPGNVFVPPGVFMSETPAAAPGALRDVDEGRGRAEVTVELSEPRVLLFKSTYHPAWRAEVDSEPVEAFQLTPGLLGVNVPAGTHRLRFVYGATAVKVALALAGVLAAWVLNQRRRRPSPAASVAADPVEVPPLETSRVDAWMPERREAIAVGVLLLGSLALHLYLIPATGWRQDLHWFVVWMRTAVDYGVAHVADHVWCDYPPVYLYLLKGVGLVWTAFSGGELPADDSLAARFAVKLLPSLCDLATALMLYRLARPRIGAKGALLVLAGYAYNPAVVFNSAVWGQADSVFALPLLLCGWLLARGSTALAFAMLAAAMLLKLQAVAVVPAVVAATLYLQGIRGLLAAVRGFAIASFALLLPFYLAGTTTKLFTTMVTVTQRYPFISMNANNIWWLIGGKLSGATSDLMLVGNGLFTYRALGGALLMLATAVNLWRLLRNLKHGRSEPLANILEACALQIIAFYLFPTQIHERYILPALAPLAALCIWQPRLWSSYALLSVAALVTLASALYASFPQSLGPLEYLLFANRAEALVAAVTVLAVYFVLLLQGPDRRFRLLAPAAISIAGIALVVVASIPLSGSVRLSAWQPISQTQDWGSVHLDRTVDDRRLSVFGFIFRHGIGTHAKSALRYHLNGAFRRFDTAFAIDDESNRGRDARFAIVVDGKIEFDSGDIKAGGFPRYVSVSVAGAEFLTLHVFDGGDGIDYDHADWLEPTLVR